MIKLSVNVNKVATVRNSRGGQLPSVIEAVRVCIDAGAPGITVHPRADERHITTRDVHEIADELAPLKGRVEFNIEGDPRPGFLDLVLAVKPDQCTLVPVKPGEITSEAGWPADTPAETLAGIVGSLKAAGVRVSLFVDPEPAAIRWAKHHGRGSCRVIYRAIRARVRARTGCRRRELREVHRRLEARARVGCWRQRRTRSRSEEPDVVQDAASPGRGVDRPRPHQPRDFRRAWARREGVHRGAVAGAALDSPGVAFG